MIGSYRLDDGLEPYAGVHFANHWFSTQNGGDSSLAPNQVYAPSRGYGDGLLKLAFGLDIAVARGFHLILEYAHWFPANNDPGDGYRFVSNDIVALSAAFHLSGR